jgi:hypothetical protein
MLMAHVRVGEIRIHFPRGAWWFQGLETIIRVMTPILIKRSGSHSSRRVQTARELQKMARLKADTVRQSYLFGGLGRVPSVRACPCQFEYA